MNNKGIIRCCQGRALVLSSEYKNRLTIFTKEYSPRPVGSEVSRKLYHLIIWGCMITRSKLVGPVLSEILIEEMEFHFSFSLLTLPLSTNPNPAFGKGMGQHLHVSTSCLECSPHTVQPPLANFFLQLLPKNLLGCCPPSQV